jgi:hypothetical protein
LTFIRSNLSELNKGHQEREYYTMHLEYPHLMENMLSSTHYNEKAPQELFDLIYFYLKKYILIDAAVHGGAEAGDAIHHITWYS